MEAGTDLTKNPTREELEAMSDELAAGAVAGIDRSDLVLPTIKPTQQLTREVVDRQVDAGVWLNTVTGDDYGPDIEFVIVGYVKGRFLVHKRDTPEEKTYVANGPVAPDTWPEEYAGRHFADIEDAEEVWKKRSNDPDDDHEFGKGPPITTTHNFAGFVKGEGIPARLGLSRTSATAARKILSVLEFSTRAPWASAFKLSLKLEEKGGKPYYVARATQGEQSDAETVAQAQRLAYDIKQSGAFALDGSEVEEADKDKGAKPETPAGGVEV